MQTHCIDRDTLDQMPAAMPEINRKALIKAGGRFNEAIEYISSGDVELSSTGNNRSRNQPKPADPPVVVPPPRFIFPVLTASQQQQVLRLADLGFVDEGKLRHALALASWDSDRAASLLIERNDELDSGYTGTPIDQFPTPASPFASPFGSPAAAHSPPALPPRNVDPYAAMRQIDPSTQSSGIFSYNNQQQTAFSPPKYQSFDPSSNFGGAASSSSSASLHNPFAPAAHAAPAHAPSSPSRSFARTSSPSRSVQTRGPFGAPAAAAATTTSPKPSQSIQTSSRYTAGQKQVLTEFDPFSDDNRL
eukprot:jgi/Hompol1/6225/HPOL_001336-RA